MVFIEYLGRRRELGGSYLSPGLARRAFAAQEAAEVIALARRLDLLTQAFLTRSSPAASWPACR